MAGGIPTEALGKPHSPRPFTPSAPGVRRPRTSQDVNPGLDANHTATTLHSLDMKGWRRPRETHLRTTVFETVRVTLRAALLAKPAWWAAEGAIAPVNAT